MAGKMAQTEKRYGNRHLMAGATVTSSRVGSLLRYRAAGLLAAAAAIALPVTMAQAGGPIQVANVAAGTAAFSQAGSVTTITAANNTIINYQKFGIPHGNTVDFIQPSASARVLNRIIGPSPTQIDGNLNANGVVYFVNPAGVMFGAGAVVNVGQLYAAAVWQRDAGQAGRSVDGRNLRGGSRDAEPGEHISLSSGDGKEVWQRAARLEEGAGRRP